MAEPAVMSEADAQFGGAGDYVVVGYDVTVGGYEESAAAAPLGLDEADSGFDLLGSASGRHGVLPLLGWVVWD